MGQPSSRERHGETSNIGRPKPIRDKTQLQESVLEFPMVDEDASLVVVLRIPRWEYDL